MDDLEYDLFDLKITGSRDQGYEIDVLQSKGGQPQNVAFTLPFENLFVQNIILFMSQSADGRRAGPGLAERQRKVAQDFGNKLFRALFEETELASSLRRAVDQAKHEGRGLAIRLRLSEAGELANIPWEYMADEAELGCLARSGSISLERYLAVDAGERSFTVEPPLKVLVVIASPEIENFAALKTDEEWAALNKETHELQAKGRLILERIESPTLPLLGKRLARGDVHVLHFIGHGDFDPGTGGVLLFEDGNKREDRVGGGHLIEALKDADLRLVVLNSCEGARSALLESEEASAGLHDPFAGVAQQLIRAGVPAVVAMQLAISDKAAVKFATHFYGGLNDGYSVARAVGLARNQLYLDKNYAEWATPVFYTRGQNTLLLKPGEALADSDATAATILLAASPVAPASTDDGEFAYDTTQPAQPAQPLVAEDDEDIAVAVARALRSAGFDLEVEADDVELWVRGEIETPEDRREVELAVRSSLVVLRKGRSPRYDLTTRAAPDEPSDPGARRGLVVALVAFLVVAVFLVAMISSGFREDGDIAQESAPTTEPSESLDPPPVRVPDTTEAIESELASSNLPDLDAVPDPAGEPIVITGTVESPDDIVQALEIANEASDNAGGEDIAVDITVPIGDIGVLRVEADDQNATATVVVYSSDDEAQANEVADGVLAQLEVDVEPQSPELIFLDIEVRDALDAAAPTPGAFDELTAVVADNTVTIGGYTEQASDSPLISQAITTALTSVAATSGIQLPLGQTIEPIFLDEDLQAVLDAPDNAGNSFPQVTATIEDGVVTLTGIVPSLALLADPAARVTARLGELGADYRVEDGNLQILGDVLVVELAKKGLFIFSYQVAASPALIQIDDDGCDGSGADFETLATNVIEETVRDLAFEQPVEVLFKDCELAMTGSSTQLLAVIGSAITAAGLLLVQFSRLNKTLTARTPSTVMRSAHGNNRSTVRSTNHRRRSRTNRRQRGALR